MQQNTYDVIGMSNATEWVPKGAIAYRWGSSAWTDSMTLSGFHGRRGDGGANNGPSLDVRLRHLLVDRDP